MVHDVPDIDVFILCGGEGKRLRRVSGGTPKPMIRIGRRPFLDILLDYLADLGFRRFVLGTGYRAEIIERYYRQKRKRNFPVSFSREKKPLDTGGAIKNAKSILCSNPFLVLNGDSFCRFNARSFIAYHKQKKALISILLKRCRSQGDCGQIRRASSGRILAFQEKKGECGPGMINSGIYLFDQKIFRYMPKKKKFSLEYDLFPALVKGNIFGYVAKGSFLDIGTPERFAKAQRYLKHKKA